MSFFLSFHVTVTVTVTVAVLSILRMTSENALMLYKLPTTTDVEIGKVNYAAAC